MTELRTSPVSDGDLFSERARRYALQKPLSPVHVLEAGCGWGQGLDLGTLDHRSTGVDMDTPALRAHTASRADLETWHLGDLRTVPMPPRAYDVVHAPYLIDRVPQAELVLDRFVAALRPGGLLLLRLRDRGSAFGLLDRGMPPWLRDRLLTGLAPRRRGAAPGPPPPALYDEVASRQGIRWYCAMRGLVVAEEYVSRERLAALGPASGPVSLLCRVMAACSRGRLSAGHSEVTFVIRKPESRFARVI
ncbi:class I SAM-dependent methyltransferase [Actinomadura macrotermitis]|uniref:Methyltransferase type 11 domain-containing protein n=1 Tax=Actinomadura macrotermitis TaxID=2585200 RepID=A0A7K0BS76_9ACTN|nr:hypothetical protein [Actinomadura macrotermitis]